jgi:hypothetical protein
MSNKMSNNSFHQNVQFSVVDKWSKKRNWCNVIAVQKAYPGLIRVKVTDESGVATPANSFIHG